MSLFKDITDLLASIPTNAVLKQRLEALGADAKAMEEKIRTLEKENSELVETVKHMAGEIAKQSALTEYVDHAGAVFKRDGRGGYCGYVVCPVCHKPSGVYASRVICAACGWMWARRSQDIHAALAELKAIDAGPHD